MALVILISSTEICHKIVILDSPKEKIPEVGCRASFPASFPSGLPSGFLDLADGLDLASRFPDRDLHVNEHDIVKKNYFICKQWELNTEYQKSL